MCTDTFSSQRDLIKHPPGTRSAGEGVARYDRTVLGKEKAKEPRKSWGTLEARRAECACSSGKSGVFPHLRDRKR